MFQNFGIILREILDSILQKNENGIKSTEMLLKSKFLSFILNAVLKILKLHFAMPGDISLLAPSMSLNWEGRFAPETITTVFLMRGDYRQSLLSMFRLIVLERKLKID